MNFRDHADKIAYFFIAFALFLIVRSFVMYRTEPPLNMLLYMSIAISLLASNVPRVLDIPMHYAHPARRIEFFFFFLSLLCFVALCLAHVFA